MTHSYSLSLSHTHTHTHTHIYMHIKKKIHGPEYSTAQTCSRYTYSLLKFHTLDLGIKVNHTSPAFLYEDLGLFLLNAMYLLLFTQLRSQRLSLYAIKWYGE